MRKTFVVGDIHGCAESFKHLIFKEIKIQKEDHFYLLGDYVDRGPDSKDVIDTIIGLQEEGYNLFPLRGNHEQFFLEASHGPSQHQFWLKNGGYQTLESFRASTIFDVPEKYMDFLHSLPYYYEIDGYYLVHAGFNFQSRNPFSDYESMMLIRNFKADPQILGSRKIIHGHTPLPLYEIRRYLQDKEAFSFNLDGGCVYKDVPGQGNLLALELETWKLYVQPNVEKIFY